MNQTEAQKLYQFVKDNKAAIETDAAAGDSNAKAIITTYKMLTRFVESGALGILAAAIEDWKTEREEAMQAANEVLGEYERLWEKGQNNERS